MKKKKKRLIRLVNNNMSNLKTLEKKSGKNIHYTSFITGMKMNICKVKYIYGELN